MRKTTAATVQAKLLEAQERIGEAFAVAMDGASAEENRKLRDERAVAMSAVQPMQGIAQFMPQTAADMGLDNPFDPLQAIPASARLLRNLFQQFGNFGLAAAAYNAGPKRIQDWLSKKGGLPEETQGYVKVITGREAENFRAGKRGDLAITVPKRAPCQEAAKVYAANQVPIPVAAPGRPQKTVHIAAKEKPAKANTKVASGKTPAAAEKKGALQLAARKNVKGKMRLSSAK